MSRNSAANSQRFLTRLPTSRVIATSNNTRPRNPRPAYPKRENRQPIRATIADMKTALMALIVLATSPAAADIADEVRCREVGFSQAAEAQDLAAFESFIDADARFVGSSVLRGIATIVEAWTFFFEADGPTIKWRPQIVEVLDDNKLALSRGPYRVLSRDPEGNLIEQWGTFNSVWRLNDDGEWRVVFDAGNEAASAPDDATRAFLDADTDCP